MDKMIAAKPNSAVASPCPSEHCLRQRRMLYAIGLRWIDHKYEIKRLML